MHILGKNAKKRMQNSYTKEYNLVAISSLIFAIIVSLSFIIGSIIIYSYLNKLHSSSLFPSTISNERLVYLSSFLAFFILLIIVFYTISPSIIFINKYGKKASNKLKDIFIKDLIAYNIIFIFLFLAFRLYSIPSSEWAESLYLLNIMIEIVISLSPIYIIYSRKEKQNLELSSTESYLKISLHKFFMTLSYLTAPIFVLTWGFEVNKYIDCSSDIISLLIFLFIFAFIPIILSWIFNSAIIYWNNEKRKSNYIALTLLSILWIIPIYHASPIIIKASGLSDSQQKIYYIEENFIKTNLEPRSLIIEVENHSSINNESDENIEYNKYRAYCGRIYWNIGDTIVFKKNDSGKFLHIPTNKIFEYQGNTDKINCNSTKQFSKLDYLKYRNQ